MENSVKIKSRKRHPGVYSVNGKKGISFGKDYIHPQTGERIRKIIKGCKSAAEAFEIRSIEIADAARGIIDTAYGRTPKISALLFEDMIDLYLDWSLENKKSWSTDKQRSSALKMAFKGKLMTDITSFMVERFKIHRSKEVSKSTVNKLILLI